jgi:hypothetical protein
VAGFRVEAEAKSLPDGLAGFRVEAEAKSLPAGVAGLKMFSGTVMTVPINLRLLLPLLPLLLPLLLPCQGPLGYVLSLFGLDVVAS